MREAMLILHFIGLAMGLGTSFAFAFLGSAASKLSEEESFKFMATSSVVSRMGHIGLTLLVLTGLYLMTPYWSTLSDMPMLIIKLVLVLVLGALIGIMSSKMKKVKSGDAPAMKSIQSLGPLAMLTGVAIVVLAVVTFK